MKQTATVLEVKGKKIIVGCDKSACEGCKGSIFCNNKHNEFEVVNMQNIVVKKGDRVILDLPTGKTLFTSFMSFIFPLILFFAGMVTTFFITPNQIWQFGGGFIGLVIAFVIAGIYFKITRDKYRPEIIEKNETTEDK